MANILEAGRANAVLSVTGAILSLIASIVVVRVLGTTLYAEYAMVLALITWGLLIAEAGSNAGFMRYLGEAAKLGARASLYRSLLTRRWIILTLVGAAMVWIGPIWAKFAGLPSETWSAGLFAIITLAVASGLTGQLAYHGLLGTFRHREALLLMQVFAIVRASVLVGVALVFPQIAWLAGALVIVVTIEAFWYHRFLFRAIALEKGRLPHAMVSLAWRHGLVTVFDKITSAVGGTPFLLLVLAAYYTRVDLAFLAVAADLVQKSLTLAGLPAGNMVLPYLNAASGNGATLVNATVKVVKVAIFLFLTGLGGLYVALPSGLPLLYGEDFAKAVLPALLLAAPVFVDAWARFALVSSLTTKGCYREVLVMNGIQALLALILLVATVDKGLVAVLVAQGAVRLVIALGLVVVAMRAGLLVGLRIPYALIGTVLIAVGIGLGAGEGIARQWWGNWSLLIGLVAYLLVLIAGLRAFRGFDRDLVVVIQRLAGRYQRWLNVIVPAR